LWPGRITRTSNYQERTYIASQLNISQLNIFLFVDLRLPVKNKGSVLIPGRFFRFDEKGLARSVPLAAFDRSVFRFTTLEAFQPVQPFS
jgi:hypothetical protein